MNLEKLIYKQVEVEYWERVHIGREEESMITRCVRGRLINADDDSVVIDTPRNLYKIKKTRVDHIKVI